MTLIQKIIPMQSHQFHNLQGTDKLQSCDSWSIYREGGGREQETKQRPNRGIYSMDTQAPSPHPTTAQQQQGEGGPVVLRGRYRIWAMYSMSHINSFTKGSRGSSRV